MTKILFVLDMPSPMKKVDKPADVLNLESDSEEDDSVGLLEKDYDEFLIGG